VLITTAWFSLPLDGITVTVEGQTFSLADLQGPQLAVGLCIAVAVVVIAIVAALVMVVVGVVFGALGIAFGLLTAAASLALVLSPVRADRLAALAPVPRSPGAGREPRP
jgi:hypothetical protein